MDKLRAMKLFVKVADTGSFIKVANEMNVSKSMISKEVSKLEAEIGARLLHRSTRSLQLTEIGEGYLLRCKKILLKIEDTEWFVQDMQSSPRGSLRINAPMALGLTDLNSAFSAFMQAFPNIELDISLSDEPVDLIHDGFDIGFRAMSKMVDLNYAGKPIMDFKLHVVASPEYINANPLINAAKDLVKHNCFAYTYAMAGATWPIGSGVSISGQLKANNTIFIKQAARDGRGVALLPSFVCRTELEDGRLIELLPDAKRPTLKFYVLYPAREFVPLKTKSCVDFMGEWFSSKRVHL
ncbi:MAG: LysR family transcriptional regulator [Gammaproteobacteria bacterium]|nr:LysR family transcriptional regulator [Gammaproteobacteria bacterium]